MTSKNITDLRKYAVAQGKRFNFSTEISHKDAIMRIYYYKMVCDSSISISVFINKDLDLYVMSKKLIDSQIQKLQDVYEEYKRNNPVF